MIKSKEAINELRNSYELKNKRWATKCLDMIEEEFEKKDKIINNMSNYIYNVDYRSECGNTREQVKQYFENKVEGE